MDHSDVAQKLKHEGVGIFKVVDVHPEPLVILGADREPVRTYSIVSVVCQDDSEFDLLIAER